MTSSQLTQKAKFFEYAGLFMVMKEEIRSIDLHVLAKEWQVLVQGKVEKVYHLSEKYLLFHFHVPGKGSLFLHLDIPQKVYLSQNKAIVPEVPSGFCMFLRKKLSNARVKSIEQLGSERVVKIIFETKETKFHFFIELFGKGNAMLCNEQNLIISLLQPQSLGARTLRGGVAYVLPERAFNIFSLAQAQLSKIPITENISKTLALELGIGGMYAEELCFRAKIDPKAKKLSQKELETLYQCIQGFIHEKTQGYAFKDKDVLVDIVPYNLQKYASLSCQAYPALNEALDAVFSVNLEKAQQQAKKSPHEKKLSKIQIILAAQAKQVAAMQKQALEEQKKGELIYEHYQEIDELLKEISILRKTRSWDEVKKKLGKKIFYLDEKQGMVEIELS